MENLDISLLLVVSQKVMLDIYVLSAAVFNVTPLVLLSLKLEHNIISIDIAYV
jgi:hypothetical protein